MADDQNPQPLDLSQFGGVQVQSTPQSSGPLDLSAFGGKQVTPSIGTSIQQVRYTAPGQGVQEFTSGSPEEKQFLGRFPMARPVPVSGRSMSYTAQANTPYQQAEAAEVAESNRKAAQALKTGAIVGGSVIAPELLPEIGGVVGLGARAAATAAGAGAGTVAGQAATGENPLTAESAKESLKNAAVYGAADLGFGAAGKLVGKVADSIKNLVHSPGDVAEEGAKVIRGIAGGDVPGENQVVKNVQEQLGKAENELHVNYENKLNEISQNAKGIPVHLADSPLQRTAKELLGDVPNIPAGLQGAMRGIVADNERIRPLLEAFAAKAPDSLETYTWDEVEATRQAIGAKVRELPYGDPNKWPLIRLRSAIDDTLEQAAEDANNVQLSNQMKSLRANYAQKINLFQNKAIEALSDKNPDAVADILLNKQNSIERVKDLRNLIGEQNMHQVEGSMLDRLIQKSTVGDEVNAAMLRKSFYRINPDVRMAVWGENLPAVTAFMDGVVKNNVKGRASSLLLNTLAHYGMGKGAAGGGLTGAVFGVIRGDDPERVLRDVAIGSAVGTVPGLAERYGPKIENVMNMLQRAVGEGEGTVGKTAVKKAADSAVEPTYAYRVRDVGDEGIPSGNHAATLSEEEARGYAASREAMNGKPQEIVRTDLNNLQHTRSEGPNGNDWVKFEKDVPESSVEVMKEKSGESLPAPDKAANKKVPVASRATAAAATNQENKKESNSQSTAKTETKNEEVVNNTNTKPETKPEQVVEDDRSKGASATSSRRVSNSLGELSLHNAVEAAGGKSSDFEFSNEGGDVSQLLEQAAHESGVPSDILHAVAQQESGMNPRALSNKGAKGVMQLMDSTASRMGVKNPYNPSENVSAGAKYLAELHNEFKHWDQALGAYNWGADKVRGAVKEHGVDWLDFAPRETRHYVRAILAQREK